MLVVHPSHCCRLDSWSRIIGPGPTNKQTGAPLRSGSSTRQHTPRSALAFDSPTAFNSQLLSILVLTISPPLHSSSRLDTRAMGPLTPCGETPNSSWWWPSRWWWLSSRILCLNTSDLTTNPRFISPSSRWSSSKGASGSDQPRRVGLC